MANYKLPIITGTSLSIGDVLRWDGSNWVNYADSNYGAAVHTHDTHILQLDGINSNGGAFPFTTSGAVTFSQNLIFPNGGSIGQTDGPLLTFDDTNDYLEITGCQIGIGTSTPGSTTGAYAPNIPLDLVSVGQQQCFFRFASGATGVDVCAFWLHPYDCGDGGWFVGTNNVGKLRLAYDAGSGGNERLAITATKDGTMGITIQQDNKVGFGTKTPGQIFEISDPNALIRFRHETDDAGSMGIEFAHRATDAIIKTAIISEGQGAWGRANLHFVVDTATDVNPYIVGTDTKLFIAGATGKVHIGGISPKTLLTLEGTLTLKEQAAADADTAAYGQIWIKNTAPCTPWFTDDVGNDGQFMLMRSTSINADSDAADVQGCNVLWVDTSGGNVVLGGLANGVDNQLLYVFKYDEANILTIEHQEGTGTQKFMLKSGNYVYNGVGICVPFICKNGTWYIAAYPRDFSA